MNKGNKNSHKMLRENEAYSLESDKINYLNIYDDYIANPIPADELRQKMKKYLDK